MSTKMHLLHCYLFFFFWLCCIRTVSGEVGRLSAMRVLQTECRLIATLDPGSSQRNALMSPWPLAASPSPDRIATGKYPSFLRTCHGLDQLRLSP